MKEMETLLWVLSWNHMGEIEILEKYIKTMIVTMIHTYMVPIMNLYQHNSF